jgi:hypothetical protein
MSLGKSSENDVGTAGEGEEERNGGNNVDCLGGWSTAGAVAIELAGPITR